MLQVLYVMLNLFVAVIIEGFDETVEGDGLNKEQFELFAAEWSKYDPMASTFIPRVCARALLKNLTVLTGIPEDPSEADLTALISSLKLKPFDNDEHHDEYYFGDVIHAIAKRLLRLVSAWFAIPSMPALVVHLFLPAPLGGSLFVEGGKGG